MTLTVTESARNKIESMCIESNMVAVRPFVQGTGCYGMTHSLTFADQRLEMQVSKLTDKIYGNGK